MERKDEKEVQHRIGAVLVILALVLALVSMGLLIYYATLPPPPGSRCGNSPTAQLEATETLAGYRFEISSVSRNVPLDCFKVSVLKNGTPLFPGLPTNVTEGNVGAIQGGENLDFTDSDGDGRLTVEDYFTLERLDSGTLYELVLIWAASDNKISSDTVQTP